MEILMEVFDKDFVRIGTFNNYSSIMYNRTLSDQSNYTLNLPFERESVDLLMAGSYLLIDETFLAEMKYIQKTEDSISEIVSKGYNVKNLLQERCFYPMQIFGGTAPEVMRQMVINNVTSPADARRKIKEIKLGTYPYIDSRIDMQQTGNSVYEELVKIADEYQIGFEIIPNIVEYEDLSTNIESLYFNVFKGVDHTEGNPYGNSIVEFSVELNNMESTSYVRDAMNYRNVAYVAGEGERVGDDEESARIVIEMGDMEASGLDRKEVFVDARDCQKQREDGSYISDYTYDKMLRRRGSEKLVASKIIETYGGTVLDGDNTYIYGVDFKEGDLVTLKDEDLGLKFDTVITNVMITKNRQGTYLDVTFGYDNV